MPGTGDFVQHTIDYMALIESKLDELATVDKFYAGKVRHELNSISHLNDELKRLGDSSLSEQDNLRAFSNIRLMTEAGGIIRLLFEEHNIFVPSYA